MLSLITGGLAAIFGGGITGLLGSVVSNVMNYFKEKQQLAHDLEMRKLDIQLAQMEADSKKQQAEAEIDQLQTSLLISQVASMQTAMSQDQATYATGAKARDSLAFIIIDFLRGIIRPLLTIFYTVIGMYITFQLHTMVVELKESPDPIKLLDMYESAIMTILYMTSSIGLWWFGIRPNSKDKSSK